jgi:hypothetical protein
VDDAIEQVIGDVLRYSEVGDRLAVRLAEQTVWHHEDIERLRSGATLGEAIRATRSADRSREMTRLLAEFEHIRRELRVSVTAAALHEGMTITEIAEIFGVSRQLANRMVNEARTQSTRRSVRPER